MTIIKYKKLHPLAKLEKQNKNDAGYDISAFTKEKITI